MLLMLTAKHLYSSLHRATCTNSEWHQCCAGCRPSLQIPQRISLHRAPCTAKLMKVMGTDAVCAADP